jgi:hypothetical protein
MRRLPLSITLSLVLILPAVSRAASHNETALDNATLQQLEMQAERASAREQAFLYTELVQVYTQVAGLQMAAGEVEKLNATLKRIEHFAERIHDGLAHNTRKLKDAEMMMHAASYRLRQSMHLMSSEDQQLVVATIHRLDKVHDELLTQVFAH